MQINLNYSDKFQKQYQRHKEVLSILRHIKKIKKQPLSAVWSFFYWFLRRLLISFKVTTILWSSSAVIILSGSGLPVRHKWSIEFLSIHNKHSCVNSWSQPSKIKSGVCSSRLGVICYLPMPLICSEESLTRQEEEPDVLLDWEDWRDVSLVTDDFFLVCCVAVRLHSVKK